MPLQLVLGSHITQRLQEYPAQGDKLSLGQGNIPPQGLQIGHRGVGLPGDRHHQRLPKFTLKTPQAGVFKQAIFV